MKFPHSGRRAYGNSRFRYLIQIQNPGFQNWMLGAMRFFGSFGAKFCLLDSGPGLKSGS
ncbi:UNVERIFIED_CONTAM: hypothetical protein Slati_3194300 [Sesamum latifolium]|uniref:Uncharacterized protein n=1 Tax=Sesamum latifolium TaxID=2727402 RepID=A0AAW2UXA0_9LAMI